MAQLIVRNVDSAVVQALRDRAAANGRSAEAEHRAILAEVLLGDQRPLKQWMEACRRSETTRTSSASMTGDVRSPCDHQERCGLGQPPWTRVHEFPRLCSCPVR